MTEQYYSYDDDDDYDDYGEYVPTWRDKSRMLVWCIRWFVRSNFTVCHECQRRRKNCTCGLSDIQF